MRDWVGLTLLLLVVIGGTVVAATAGLWAIDLVGALGTVIAGYVVLVGGIIAVWKAAQDA